MGLARLLLAVTVAVGAAGVTTGCGDVSAGSGASLVERVEDNGAITIGIRSDQPGLSRYTVDGRYTGFDIDLATFVAGELGVAPEDIRWQDVPAAERESALVEGEVDIVVGTYSITEERRRKVDFAGPYFETGQDLLVRADDTEITGPESLDGNALCSVTGSTPAEHVQQDFADDVELVEYPRYQECVTALLAGHVDAVTTDAVILAGYAAQHPELLKVVGERFSTERYGIGLAKGDPEGRRALNDAIEEMIDSGEWRDSLESNIGASEYEIPPPPEVERG
ncbi:amino acid ABC transporter substrate-binding protein, PAAT family [Haloechinothrix alba]|uniref:Amino acid ABC transporter substrate-binding protein, PAAT family n=1 Tax=Haloechinothrix alba TaxID=664784 RepID=A0A238WN60_9PSEU|nr:glutamate ABC transporter substrate-binding protein [Haloechinothrix alba]SNR47986.1 amino acid ABC transporter substrate-binding protein, PAAT family [Haloechinothrix alba]